MAAPEVGLHLVGLAAGAGRLGSAAAARLAARCSRWRVLIVLGPSRFVICCQWLCVCGRPLTRPRDVYPVLPDAEALRHA